MFRMIQAFSNLVTCAEGCELGPRQSNDLIEKFEIFGIILQLRVCVPECELKKISFTDF